MPISSVSGSSAPEETSTDSIPEYPVQNTASYIVTVKSYENGELSGIEFNTFDKHGNMIKATTSLGDHYCAYDYNPDGTVRVKYSCNYREEYEYENGLEVKCTKYDEQGEIISVKTRTYDEHGNETSMTFDSGGYVNTYSYGYEYNENGYWIKEFGYDEDGAVKGVSIRVRGENGEVLSGTLEDKNSLLTYEYKYDENGREIEHHSTQKRGGEVTRERRVVTEYDGQDRISRKNEYRLDSEKRLVSTEEYEYLAQFR